MITEFSNQWSTYLFSKWSFHAFQSRQTRILKKNGNNLLQLRSQKYHKQPYSIVLNQGCYDNNLFWKLFKKHLLNIDLNQKITVVDFCRFLVSSRNILQTYGVLKNYIKDILISLYYSHRRYRIVEDTFYALYHIELPNFQLDNYQNLQFLHSMILQPITKARKFIEDCQYRCKQLHIPFQELSLVSKNRHLDIAVLFHRAIGSSEYLLAHQGKQLFYDIMTASEKPMWEEKDLVVIGKKVHITPKIKYKLD